MKYTFFTPGPSQLYPTVEKHLKDSIKENIPSISHRSEKFQEIFKEAVNGLRQLLRIPNTYHIVFVASGTEAMERVVQNVVEKKSYHFVNGSFGKRWYETAHELGKMPQKYEVAFGQGFTNAVDIPKDIELICFTHNETSSGVATNLEYIYNTAKKILTRLLP